MATFAALLVLRSDATYSSSSVVELYSPQIYLDANPGPITKLNALRSKYAALARTGAIVLPAAEAADLDPGRVAAASSIAITADSLIMYPTARAENRRVSQRIANAITESLVDYVAAEQTTNDIPDEQRIEIRVIQPAGLGGKVEPRQEVAVTSAVFGGAAAMALAYVIMQLVAPPRRLR